MSFTRSPGIIFARIWIFYHVIRLLWLFTWPVGGSGKGPAQGSEEDGVEEGRDSEEDGEGGNDEGNKGGADEGDSFKDRKKQKGGYWSTTLGGCGPDWFGGSILLFTLGYPESIQINTI